MPWSRLRSRRHSEQPEPRMQEAREAISSAAPNSREAADQAGEALWTT